MRKQKSKSNFMMGGAFSDEFCESQDWTLDTGVADGIIEVLSAVQGKTIADFGAGVGKYVQHFRSNRYKCVGFDGTPDIERISQQVVAFADFALVKNYRTRWDIVLALDVGQYVPKEKTKTFLANVTSHADKAVVIAWAEPPKEGASEFPTPLTHDALVAWLLEFGFVESQPLCKFISRRASRKNRHRFHVFKAVAKKK